MTATERSDVLRKLMALDALASGLATQIEQDKVDQAKARLELDAATDAFNAKTTAFNAAQYKTFKDTNDKESAEVAFNNLLASLVPGPGFVNG